MHSEDAASGNRLLAAVDYLTLAPVPAAWLEGCQPGRAVAFFPLVGAAIGAVGAVVYGLVAVQSTGLAALAAALVWTCASGVLRESGRSLLGDSLRTKVIVLAMLVIRWQLLTAILPPFETLAIGATLSLISIQTVPRAGMVAMAWTSRPQGLGTGFQLTQRMRSGSALFAVVQGFLMAMAGGGVQFALFVLLIVYLVIRLLSTLFYAKVGGVNGNALGLAEHILEVALLVLFAFLPVAGT